MKITRIDEFSQVKHDRPIKSYYDSVKNIVEKCFCPKSIHLLTVVGIFPILIQHFYFARLIRIRL